MFKEGKKLHLYVNYCDLNSIIIKIHHFLLLICEAVYGRVIDVITSAHGMRSEDYYVKLHFLKALNRKIL